MVCVLVEEVELFGYMAANDAGVEPAQLPCARRKTDEMVTRIELRSVLHLLAQWFDSGLSGAAASLLLRTLLY